MAKIKVGINGFGRIGRVVFRTCFAHPQLEIVAINDPAVDVEYIRYLIKFDSTHGKFNGEVICCNNEVSIDGQKINVFHEKSPKNIPWHSAGVEYVVEASGMFTTHEKASGHLESESVKRVIVTSPSLDVPMVILGVNHETITAEDKVISSGSSTLYCLAPIIKVLEDKYGVCDGFVTSIHAMTPSLKPLDGLCLRGKHWRDHRSIHQNIIPATTGACRALERIIPSVKNKLAGLGFRVPIVNVSVLDLTLRLNKETTLRDIFNTVENESRSSMRNIIDTSKDDAVSSDFIGDSHSCILDENSCLELRPNYFKLVCWYENEYSYACRIVDLIFFCEKQEHERPVLDSEINPLNITVCGKEIIKPFTVSNELQSTFNFKCPITVTRMICNPCQVIPEKKTVRPPYTVHAPRPLSNNAVLSKKSNEISKVWNDDPAKSPHRLPHINRNVDQRFIPETKDQYRNKNQDSNRQFEDVKKEVSNIVYNAENLLKNSQKTLELKYVSDIYRNHNSLAIDTDTEILEPTNLDDRSNLYQDHLDDSCSVNTRNSKQETNNINEIDESDNIHPYKSNRDSLSTRSDMSHKSNSSRNRRFIKLEEECFNASCNDNLIINRKNTTEEMFLDCIVEPAYSGDRSADAKKIHKINNLVKKQKMHPLTEEFCYNDPEQKIPANTAKELDFNDENLKVIHPNTSNSVENYASFKQKLEDIITDFKQNIVEVNKEKLDVNINEQHQTKTGNFINKLEQAEEVIQSTEENISTDTSKPTTNCTTNYTTTNNYQSSRCTATGEGKVNGLCRKDSGFSCPQLTKNEDFYLSYGSKSRKKILPNTLDIYDKLDSRSITDSEASSIERRKSRVIYLNDLTSSLEDLENIDKICRIIEISDELSDTLFANLESTDESQGPNYKEWSFKDLCEKIKLDEFCSKVFNS